MIEGVASSRHGNGRIAIIVLRYFKVCIAPGGGAVVGGSLRSSLIGMQYGPSILDDFRGYCGQICISSPAVGKKFQFTEGSFPEFIDQYYGRVIFALIRLRLACVMPK